MPDMDFAERPIVKIKRVLWNTYVDHDTEESIKEFGFSAVVFYDGCEEVYEPDEVMDLLCWGFADPDPQSDLAWLAKELMRKILERMDGEEQHRIELPLHERPDELSD